MTKQIDNGDGSKSESETMSDTELDKVTGGGGVRVLKEVAATGPREPKTKTYEPTQDIM